MKSGDRRSFKSKREGTPHKYIHSITNMQHIDRIYIDRRRSGFLLRRLGILLSEQSPENFKARQRLLFPHAQNALQLLSPRRLHVNGFPRRHHDSRRLLQRRVLGEGGFHERESQEEDEVLIRVATDLRRARAVAADVVLHDNSNAREDIDVMRDGRASKVPAQPTVERRQQTYCSITIRSYFPISRRDANKDPVP